MIVARNITKTFGGKQALKGVNFKIEKGQYAALLGVNGAGKTTLVRILATLGKPTHGDAFLAGYSIKKDPIALRDKIGVMSHYTFLYGDMSAEENLLFYGKMYAVPSLTERIDYLLEKVELSHRRRDLVRTFSRGMQQRLSLARAIIHDPDILLLDEPFTGLDVPATKILTDLLHEYVRKETTILMTTHDINYALANTHRILLLKQGEIVRDEPVSHTTFEYIVGILEK